MAKQTLLLLGPALVTWRTGEPPRFRSQRTVALMGYLVIERRPLTRDTLAACFWPEESLVTSRANLRRELHNLTSLLPNCWQIDRKTVAFTPSADTRVDLDMLRQLEAQEQWSRAAELVRGEFLEGLYLEDNLDFETWLMAERERWRQRAERVLMQAAQSEQQADNYSQARRYLASLLRLVPWHEQGHRQMMRLLAHSGQFSAALKHYELCRAVLANELDVGPSAATTALYKRIKSAMAEPPHNLPPQATPFIGREEEVAALKRRLSNPDCRLLTITGMGGTGKTRLALHAAQQMADRRRRVFLHGVRFVALDGLTSTNLLVSKVASAVGLTLRGRASPEQQLLNYLQKKELLLVLDDYDHLLPETKLLAAILREAPMVKLLVTSRERLDLYEEWLFELEGLSFPDDGGVVADAERLRSYDAIRLFEECAKRLHPRFSLATSLPDIIRICRLVYGVPLALELAASQLRGSSCRIVAESIERSLDNLKVSFPNIPPRHRSLRATFDWSWNYMSPSEQDLMTRLTVFRGGFTGEAAYAVAGAPLVVISTLVDKSLLGTSQSGRYSMHELVRQYTGEKDTRSAGVGEARERHLSYFLALVEQAELELQGPKQLTWLTQLETEYYNIIAALQYGAEEGKWQSAARLAGAMGGYWAIRGYLSEGSHWLDKIVAPGETIPNPLRAKILMASGWLAFEGGHYRRARRLYEASLTAWQETGNTRSVAELLNRLGHAVQQEGDYDGAVAYYEESLQLYEQLDDVSGIALALNRLGHAAQLQGEYARAATLVEASLRRRRELGDRRGMASCLNALGEIARAQGDEPEADRLYEACLALCQELGDKRCVAGVSHNLGHVRQYRGDYESALTLFEEALRLYAEMDHGEGIALCLAGLAGVAGARGRVDEAARLLGAAEIQLQSAGSILGPADQRDWEHIIVQVKEQLDEETFAAAWEAGRAFSREQAIALALQGANRPESVEAR